MTIHLVIDLFTEETIERFVNWELPILPRMKEEMFIDSLVKDIPKEDKKAKYRVWSIEWHYSKKFGMHPKMFIEHVEL